MVGIEKECTFKGNIMEHKDYVLYESLGKGDCDFSAKPILVCARSERMKVIYEESDWYWLLGSYNKIKVFDLIDDPGEKKPLTKKTYSKSDEYKMLVNAARSRSKEIRSMHKYEISLSNILKMNIRNNIKRFFRVLRRLV